MKPALAILVTRLQAELQIGAGAAQRPGGLANLRGKPLIVKQEAGILNGRHRESGMLARPFPATRARARNTTFSIVPASRIGAIKIFR